MNIYYRSNAIFEHGPQHTGQELISVVVSLYNYSHFIAQTLESVVGQTYSPIELVVIDDSSTDDSVDVMHDWMQQNASRFVSCQLRVHTENRGLAFTRNTGIHFAKSDYVFILDADNLLYPRALARLYEAMEGRSYGAAYSQVECFGSARRLGDADVWSKASFLKANYVDAMALIRKEALDRVDGYTHIEGGWEDYDLWCKFIENGIDCIFVPELLFRYRIHDSSMLRTETNRGTDAIYTQMLIRHPWLDLC